MTGADREEDPHASPDAKTRLAALRASGADRYDPVRLHHVAALAMRASACRADVRRLLDARLSEALAAFEARFEQAKRDAGADADRAVRRFPDCAADLRALLTGGDFRELRKRIAQLDAAERRAPLGALVRELDRRPDAEAGTAPGAIAGARPELKAISRFRSTWSRLSVERQVSQALGQAPKNPGPINSHMLVLRSLALMRDISPAYLDRFMSYAETLLALDHDEGDKPAKAKKRPAAKAARK